VSLFWHTLSVVLKISGKLIEKLKRFVTASHGVLSLEWRIFDIMAGFTVTVTLLAEEACYCFRRGLSVCLAVFVSASKSYERILMKSFGRAWPKKQSIRFCADPDVLTLFCPIFLLRNAFLM